MGQLRWNFKMRYIGVALGLLLAAPPLLMAQSVNTQARPSSRDVLINELVYRVRFGRYDDIKLLLNNDADPNTITSKGDPLLSLAVTRHDDEAAKIVQLLLDAGAKPDVPDRTGTLPIMVAAMNGDKQIIISLIKAGADFRVKTSDGTPVVEVARHSGTPEAGDPIQEALDRDEAYSKSLRTQGRYENLMRRYTMSNCIYQYWNYYLLSGQNTAEDHRTKERIAQANTDIRKLVREIQTYYPGTRSLTLQELSAGAMQRIRSELDDLISNRNREEHGIGKKEDVETRCKAITNSFSYVAAPK
jgi:hypothetical protein